MKTTPPALAPRILALLLAAFLPHLHAALPEGTKVIRDISYVTGGHARQKLDLYLPPSPRGPLFVYIHGGAWREGSKNHVMGLDIINQGYAVASVEYRFSQDAVFPAQIQDCKAAIRWLRANAAKHGYNPKQIAVMGDSAGGHLTALLATTGHTKEFDVGENLDQSSAIQCAVDFYGPTDFPGWKPVSPNPMIQTKGKKSAMEQLFGGPITEKTELARMASPVTWITKDAAPVYIMHGTTDHLVGVEQSTNFAEKLKAAGVDVKIEVITGAGHGGPQFFTPERIESYFTFIDSHLGKAR